MIKFCFVVLCMLFINSMDAKAFELSYVNKLYNVLEEKHSSTIDFKKISLEGIQIINEFDDDFRLFSSDTKAYLYCKNQLVKKYDLPISHNKVSKWVDVITDIINTYNKYSLKTEVDKNRLQDMVIENITKNIDKYSRIEPQKNETSKLKFEIDNNVLVISSQKFYKGFAEDIKRIVSTNKNIQGLVLDLRNNRGGFFSEAVKVADLFLDNSLIAYSVEDGNTNYYNSSNGDILDNKKIVVLVNSKTASAAEIVTAALLEQSRALVVGTKTFGKGSIQSVYNVLDKNLYVTSGVTYTPSGKIIDNEGIIPQICTGVHNSCSVTDNKNTLKDIILAINLIKNNLG